LVPRHGGRRDREEEAILTARDLWRWTDERGVQRLVGTDELRAALTTGLLLPSTLVWRDGMKEWAPASSMPELASAAFAAAEPPKAGEPPKPIQEEESFDGRSTIEKRSVTLLGLPPPTDEPLQSHPLDVPGAGPRPERQGVTQIPPFGAPLPEIAQVAAAITAAPGGLRLRAPTAAAPRPAPAAEPVVPAKRKLMTSDIDGLWSGPPSEEDETLPHRPRASALAAAAASSAEASARRGPDVPKALPFAAGQQPGRAASKPPPLPHRPVTASGARLGASGVSVPSKPAAPVPVTGGPPVPPGTGLRPQQRPPIRTTTSIGLSSLAKGPPPLPAQRKTGASANGAAPPEAATGAVRIKPPPLPVVRVTPEPPLSAPTLVAAPAPADERPLVPMFLTTLTDMQATVAPEKPPVADPGPAPNPPPARVTPQPPAVEYPGGSKRQITATLVSPTASPPLPAAAPPVAPPEAPEPVLAPPPAPVAPVEPPPLPPLVHEPAHEEPRAPAVAAAPTASIEAPPTPTEPLFEAAGSDAPPITEPLHIAPQAPAAPSPVALPDPATALPPRAPAPSRALGRLPDPSRHPIREVRASQPSYSGIVGNPTPRPREVSSNELPSPPAREGPATMRPRARPGLPSTPGRAPMLSLSDSKARLAEPVPVPVSSLLGAGGLLIGMVVAAFFVGRASEPEARITAVPGFGAIPALARAALPPPLKPCWMVKQPVMWAPRVSKSIPFDVAASGEASIAVGYASDAKEAVGIDVSLVTGEIQARDKDNADDEIEHVFLSPAGRIQVARTDASAGIKSPLAVPAAPPFWVGLGDSAIVAAAALDATPGPLWPITGEEALGAASVHAAGDTAGVKSFLLTYRRGGAIWSGWVRSDRRPVGDLVKAEGSGGAVGKPSGGWNGREIALIFADRPEEDGHYEMRIGHASPGALPASTAVLPMPKGGPGGDAFAPDIAGLPDGRWLLVWTEGAAGSRAVRAQTLNPDLTPLGDPIALSPPAGNFGQGVIGIAGAYAATVFLSKGASSYELWGAVLQCG
jgi:hypothetical protein